MVRLRSPAPISQHMGDFPSGQRGQTVNLLSTTSVVRIHHPPPIKKTPNKVSFLLVVNESSDDISVFDGNVVRNLRASHNQLASKWCEQILPQGKNPPSDMIAPNLLGVTKLQTTKQASERDACLLT